MGPTWHEGHVGPLVGRPNQRRGRSPSGTPTPPPIQGGVGRSPTRTSPSQRKGGEGVLEGLHLPLGRPALPLALGHLYKEGEGRTIEHTRLQAHHLPKRAAAPLLLPGALAHYSIARRCRRRTSTSSTTRERCWDDYPDTYNIPAASRIFTDTFPLRWCA